MASLLEKALSAPVGVVADKTHVTDEHYELAAAFLDGRITRKQAQVALGTKGDPTFTIFNIVVRGFRAGYFKKA